jgi:hypothetical protein
MKKLVLVIFTSISTLSFAQKTKNQIIDTVCFTKQQAADISFVLDSLWLVDDLNNSIINAYKKLIIEQDSLITLDSVEIEKQDSIIQYQKKIVSDLETKIELLQPKWHDKKSVWFGFGFLSALGTGILINELVK